MRKERISVKIPVKKHLHRFVRSLTASNEKGVFVNANTDFGLIFLSLLEVDNGAPVKVDPSEYYIEVEFPMRDRWGKSYDCRNVGPTISKTNIDRFNRFLDTLLRKELFDRLDLLKSRGENKRKSGKLKQEIESFLEKYEIDPHDLSYETLKKDYQRRKKRGESVLKKIVQ